MFWFKITVRTKADRGARRVSVDHYREYGHTRYLGDDVAAFARSRGFTSLAVTRLSQAAYVRATRTGE